jgi:hypothetical protein
LAKSAYSGLGAHSGENRVCVFYFLKIIPKSVRGWFLISPKLEGQMVNDHDFLNAFETAVLTAFPHRSHLRMAWLYLRRGGWDNGLHSIRGGIQRFAGATGATRKYHETITCFWACVVNAALVETPGETDFDRFIEAHPHLLDGKFIQEFYSASLLQTEEARREWVKPDIKPLPGTNPFVQA